MSVTARSPLPEALVEACAGRKDRLRDRMSDGGVDAFLVHNEHDIRYLTGFVGHDSLLLVTATDSTIISDSRYDEFLDPWREGAPDEIVMGVRHRLEQSVQALSGQRGLGRIGFQADHVTVARRDALAAAIGDEHIAPTSGLVMSLRMLKDELEIAVIERAITMQQEALRATLADLRLGMTESDLCARLEYEMKLRGAVGASFEPIIGSGPNSSVIHYMTGHAPIERGCLLVDWGAAVDGYCSDLTRTFGVGHLPDRLQEVYGIVLEAQLAAIAACRPGRTCAEIDAVARDVITQAGYGEQFGHGLGHGLGMDVHEEPYFNDLQTDVVLEPGMVMTVEPGIYLPGVGGVRIEDDVLVTKDGCRVLSDWPKDLDSAVIQPK
ncbi:MAG: M24 family metallopeptidase [Planctomycetota bacterium]|jgi:Xaa-Pro aminopeptidase